jgi:hypothetical protein
LKGKREALRERKRVAEEGLEEYAGVPDEFTKIVQTYGRVATGIEKLKSEVAKMEEGL